VICELFSLLLFFSTQGVRDGMAGRRLSGIFLRGIANSAAMGSGGL